MYPSVNCVMRLGVGYVIAMLRQQGAALFQDQWFADGRRKENGLSTAMPPEPRKTYIIVLFLYNLCHGVLPWKHSDIFA